MIVKLHSLARFLVPWK